MAADHLQLSDDGEYLWDGDQWIPVENVPLQVVGHIPDVRLSHDDNFWWNPTKQRWERVADAPAGAHPPEGPPEAHNPVSSTTPDLQEPPSAEHMEWGKAVVDAGLATVVYPASDIAEKVLGLGNDHESVLKVLERGAEGVHALEVLGIEGGLVFGGAVAATIIVPFAMWYEAIQANSAGNLHRIRWAIYNPWMHGFISGLYGENTGSNEEPFTAWHNTGHSFTAGLDDHGKRAVTGALIATYIFNTSSTEAVGRQLTHDQWNQRLNWAHAYTGLEIALSAVDS